MTPTSSSSGRFGRRVPVSLNAMIQRLNRRLAKDYQAIRSPRGRAERTNLGNYYLLDRYQNRILDYKLTPERIEKLARELDVLGQWEEVER